MGPPRKTKSEDGIITSADSQCAESWPEYGAQRMKVPTPFPARAEIREMPEVQEEEDFLRQLFHLASAGDECECECVGTQSLSTIIPQLFVERFASQIKASQEI